jgi:hypothetical protein
VLANVPRFETGKGLSVEEGTTNLFSANQAALTTDTTGFSSLRSATITRDTGAAYRIFGSGALKVVTPNVQTLEGAWPNTLVTATGGQTYTMSIFLCGGGTVKVHFAEYKDGVYVTDTVTSIITLTATPTRYSITKTIAADSNGVSLYVRTDVQQGITFYMSGLQCENKAYATSWQLPGSARNAEVVTVPTAGVLSASQFTVEALVNVTAETINTAAIQNPTILCTIDNAGGSFQLRLDNASPNTKFAFWTFTTGYATPNGVTSAVISPGIYRVAAKKDGVEQSVWVNGVKCLIPSAPANMTGLSSNAYIGSFSGLTSFSNSQISDVVISSRARTDAELAARGVLTPLGCDKDTTWYAPLTSSVAHQCNSTGASKILDRSGFGNHATNYGTTVVAGPNGVGRNMKNPLATYIATGSSYNPRNITIVAWVKNTRASWTPVLTWGSEGTNGYFLNQDNSGHLYFYVAVDGTLRAQTTAASTNDGKIHMWCGTYDGSKTIQYLDGVTVSTRAWGSNLTGSSNNAIIIGSQTLPPDVLYDAKIFNYALSAAEVKQLYENTRWRYQ